MPTEITIPRLGWSMDEGNFVGWLKQNGELVKAGEPLFTLENEKAAQDIEAIETGVLSIPQDAPQPGSVVKVGQLIGYLLLENEKVDRKSTGARPLDAHEKKTEDTPNADSVIPVILTRPPKHEFPKMTPSPASPRARRRAAELGVDTTRLQGSGRTGRIIEADVLKAAASQGRATMASS